MSFAKVLKEEILERKFNSKIENICFLSAIIANSGSLFLGKNGYNLEIESDNTNLILAAQSAIQSVYNCECSIEFTTHDNYFKTFLLKVSSEITSNIVNDTQYLQIKGGQVVSFKDGAPDYLDTALKIRAYIIGMVASIATIVVPQSAGDDTYTGGYHFEMLFSNEQMAYDVMNLLSQVDIFVKKIMRGEQFSLYIKDSEMISDILAFCGANNAVLELNNIMIAKEMRNNVNRAQNCSMANLDKSIEAGQKQYLAIKKIMNSRGLDSMPEKLKEIAVIRLQNPEMSLEEIAECLSESISKSGINHRFRKIIEIASEIKEGENE